MGCLYGGPLARAGYPVVLLDTWYEHVEAIATSGLRLDHEGQTEIISVAATGNSSRIDPVDVAIVFVNANSTSDAAVEASKILRENGVAVTLQNGVGNRDALAVILGELFAISRAAGDACISLCKWPDLQRCRGHRVARSDRSS